jgi:hypothetical protein
MKALSCLVAFDAAISPQRALKQLAAKFQPRPGVVTSRHIRQEAAQ